MIKVVAASVTHCADSTLANDANIQCDIFGWISLLVWTARAVFMRPDIAINIPHDVTSWNSPAGSSWQQLLLDNMLYILMHGSLSEDCKAIFKRGVDKGSIMRFPGAHPLHLRGADASSSFLMRPDSITKGTDNLAKKDSGSSVIPSDMDIIDASTVGDITAVDYMKYILSQRMLLLSSNTDKCGYILSSKENVIMTAFWKQKIFHRMFPLIYRNVIGDDESTDPIEESKVLLLWALCGVLSGTPYTIFAGGTDTKISVLRVLAYALGAKKPESQNLSIEQIIVKTKSAALVPFEEFLINEDSPALIIPYLATVIPRLLEVSCCCLYIINFNVYLIYEILTDA